MMIDIRDHMGTEEQDSADRMVDRMARERTRENNRKRDEDFHALISELRLMAADGETQQALDASLRLMAMIYDQLQSLWSWVSEREDGLCSYLGIDCPEVTLDPDLRDELDMQAGEK